MLCIRQIRHLERVLGTTADKLEAVLSNADSYYKTLILNDPAKPNKPREVVNVTGEIRNLQLKLYRKLLLPKLVPSPHSHGGIRGRSILTNADAHAGSRYLYKADISNFYPSIHSKRVYALFSQDFACSPDVARFCARLCSYRYHLALGLITSPILADQVLHCVDARVNAACVKAGLVYTRYVDDITISGQYDLQTSGSEAIISDILNDNGFLAKPEKSEFGSIPGQIAITSIRISRGHFDVTKEYALELERQLDDACRLASGQSFDGPYYAESQLRGRLQFVLWVNPLRRKQLMKKFNMVRWDRVAEAATRLGLIATKKTLRRPPEPIVAMVTAAGLAASGNGER